MPESSEAAGGEVLVRYADLVPRFAGMRGADDGTAAQPELFDIAEGEAVEIHGVRHCGTHGSANYIHDGAEILFVHRGRWLVRVGSRGEDTRLELGPGDISMIPPQVLRSVATLDEEPGFMLTIRGPSVEPMAPPPELRSARAAGNAIRLADLRPNPASALSGRGVEEAGIIASCATRDGFEPGILNGAVIPGFNLRLLTLQSGGYVPSHVRGEAEVLFVQEGAVEIRWEVGAIMVCAGDTLSVPIGAVRSFRNTTSGRTLILVMRGSLDPLMPVFPSMHLHGWSAA